MTSRAAGSSPMNLRVPTLPFALFASSADTTRRAPTRRAPDARSAAIAKADLLSLAARFGGRDDPGAIHQTELSVVLARLLEASPQTPLAARRALLVGAWRQVFGPMDYHGGDRGFDPALRANEIYQVVLEGGVLYNVTPLVEARGGVERTALLRGEYTTEPGFDDVLRVRFTSFRGLRGALPEGRALPDLPALAERGALGEVPSITPSWVVRAFFRGGVLHEVYTDHDLRVLYGASAPDADDRYLYVMRRVPALV